MTRIEEYTQKVKAYLADNEGKDELYTSPEMASMFFVTGYINEVAKEAPPESTFVGTLTTGQKLYIDESYINA